MLSSAPFGRPVRSQKFARCCCQRSAMAACRKKCSGDFRSCAAFTMKLQSAARSVGSFRSKDGLFRPALDRKSVVSGKSVSVRVDLGGRRIIKKKKYINHIEIMNEKRKKQ